MKLPHTMKRYGTIDGVMVMPPAPSWEHQWVAADPFWLLDAHARRRGIGVMLFAPLALEVQHDLLRTRQPDLTVEILSPNDTRADIQGKMDDYQRIRNHGADRAVWAGEMVRSDTLPDLHLPVDDIFA